MTNTDTQTTVAHFYEKQELFDIVVAGIFSQGGPSIKENIKSTICLYRSQSGRKCAAGLVLPDTEYSTDFEHKICTVISWFKMHTDINFLEELQKIHDRYASNSDKLDKEFFKECIPEMINLGKENNLSLAIFSKFI